MNSINFFTHITHIFAPTVILLVCVLLFLTTCLYMYAKKIAVKAFFQKQGFFLLPNFVKASYIIVKSTALTALLVVSIKEIVKAPRPENMLIIETGYAFPSGHAALAFSFFVAIAYCLYVFKQIKSGWFLLIIAALVATSRVVLHVHSLKDVVVGSLLGALSVIVVIMYIKFHYGKYVKN